MRQIREELKSSISYSISLNQLQRANLPSNAQNPEHNTEEDDGEGKSLIEPKEDIYQIIQDLVKDDVILMRVR